MPKSLSINFFNTRSKRAFGLLGFALTLGATGALVTQNSSQNIARNTSSNATMRTSLLKRDNQGLKTTHMHCEPFWWLGIGRCRWIPEPSWEDQRQNQRIEELERRVDRHDWEISGIGADIKSINQKLDKIDQTNILLEKINNNLEKQNSPTTTTTRTRTPSKTKTTKKSPTKPPSRTTTTKTPSRSKTTKRS